MKYFAAIAILLLLVPGASPAQEEDPALLSVRLVTVHPEKEQDFMKLQVDLAGQLKDFGPRDVWREVEGGAGRYHVVGPSTYEDSASPFVDSDERIVLRLYPHLSTVPLTGEQSEFLVLTYTTINPDRHEDYEVWLQNVLRPVLIATGVHGVSFTRVLGEDVWIRSAPANAIDDPHPTDFADRLTSEDHDTYLMALDALDAIVVSEETIVLQHVPLR